MGDIRVEDYEDQNKLQVILTPHSDDGTTLSSLDVELLITAPAAQAGAVLLTLQTEEDNTAHQHYDKDTISASGADGDLPLDRLEDTATQLQSWTAPRATRGQVSVKLHATPRHVDQSTPIGGRTDLRSDGGGLQGA